MYVESHSLYKHLRAGSRRIWITIPLNIKKKYSFHYIWYCECLSKIYSIELSMGMPMTSILPFLNCRCCLTLIYTWAQGPVSQSTLFLSSLPFKSYLTKFLSYLLTLRQVNRCFMTKLNMATVYVTLKRVIGT